MSWRRPFTIGALLLMEALWCYAAVAFFVAITVGGERPTVFGVGAVVFLSFAISRVLQTSAGSLAVLRVWGTVLSLLVFYVIVRTDFFGDFRLWDFTWADHLVNNTEATLEDKANAVIAIPLLWLLWMRGVIRGQQSLIFENVVGSFGLGVIVFGFVLVFSQAVDAPAAIGYVAIPYVAVGLLAIGISHAARADEDFDRSFTSTWLVAVGGAISFTAIVALLFVVIDFDSLRNLLGDVSLQLTTALVHALRILEWPLIQLFNGLYAVLYFLIHDLYGGERPQAEQEPPPEGLTEEERPKPDGEPPEWLRLLARIIIGGTLATIVLFSIAAVFAMYQRRTRPGEVKESTYESGRLTSDIGDMFGSLLGRLRPGFNVSRQNYDSMRKLYFDMLDEAQKQGIERKPNETPLELEPRLVNRFPPEPTARITRGFDDARYGGLSKLDEDVKRMRDDWEQSRR